MAPPTCASDAVTLAPLVRGLGPVAAVAGVTPLSLELATLLARELGVPARLVLVHGLGSEARAPWGAIDEEGSWVVDYFSAAGLRLDETEMGSARARGLAGLRDARCAAPQPSLVDVLPAERIVLVQRGLEQGLLMDAAVSLALRHGAEQVVVATPWATARGASRFTERENVVFVCPRVLAAPPAETRGAARPGRQVSGW